MAMGKRYWTVPVEEGKQIKPNRTPTNKQLMNSSQISRNWNSKLLENNFSLTFTALQLGWSDFPEMKLSRPFPIELALACVRAFGGSRREPRIYGRRILLARSDGCNVRQQPLSSVLERSCVLRVIGYPLVRPTGEIFMWATEPGGTVTGGLRVDQ